MKLTKAIFVFTFCVVYLMAATGGSAQAGTVSLGLYQGIQLADNMIVESKDSAADLTVTPRYRGYVAYAALHAKKLHEYKERPDIARLTAADVEKFGELVFSPSPGYYYLVKANDNRYYLCKLEKFENQGKAATYWKLTFSWEEIGLGTAGNSVSPPTDGKSYEKKIYSDGTSYEGGFANGKFQGQGILKTPDGSYYVGDFVNGDFQGRGSLTIPDGGSYNGDFINGKLNGKGIFRQSDGRFYEGDFVNNEIHGQGTTYDANGKILKKGQWEHSKFVGPVQQTVVNVPSAPVQAGVGSNSLYFFSSHYGDNGNFVRLDMDNMTIQPLGVSGSNLTVSLDGNYLVYTGTSNKYHSYDLKAGADKEFEKERADYSAPVAISPHLFAFLKESTKGTFICIKSLVSGAERQLLHRVPDRVHISAGLAFVPPLSNATTPFVVASRRDLYLISSQATSIIYTSEKDGDTVRYPSVSPDGKKIAFISDLHKGIWAINIDGTDLTQLTDMDNCSYTAWSPDGANIAFTSASSASRGVLYQDVYDSSVTARGAGAVTHRIWVMGSDGSNPHPLQGNDGNGVSIMGRVVWR